MKHLLTILTLFFFSLLVHASEPIVQLDSANSAYSKGDFEDASQQYEEILKSGFVSFEVYYNLGNTYYKLGKYGKGILYYEKAKKLAPYDEDVLFNLKLANQQTVDKIEPLPKFFLNEWWENLTNMKSEKTWAMRSIISFGVCFFFLGLFFVTKNVFTKQLGFWLTIVFFAFSIGSFLISKSSYNKLLDHNTAIVQSFTTEVKNAPSITGKKLFILHEGAKVSTSEASDEWIKIEVSADKVGWVKRADLESI